MGFVAYEDFKKDYVKKLGKHSKPLAETQYKQFVEDYDTHSRQELMNKYQISRAVFDNTVKILNLKEKPVIKYNSPQLKGPDKEILNTLFTDRNVKKATYKGYVSALKSYTIFQKLSFRELLDEAIQEQDARIPLRESKLKQRLINYRNHLFHDTDYAQRTCRTYFSKITTIYRHFEVEIPTLPLMTYDVEYVTSYSDLPTHEHIRQALNVSNPGLKAVILFMSSSGSAKAETLSLSVQQFFDGVEEYHNIRFQKDKQVLLDILNFLDERCKDKELIVPTFFLKRIKTKKYYYTFCSPEATEAIINYLKLRITKYKYLEPNQFLNSQLFKYTNSMLSQEFQNINDGFDWGKIGSYRFFRGHVLRKFNASNIGMIAEDVDNIQGRSKNAVHETYIKTKPDELRKRYMKHMWRICIDPSWKEACIQLDADSKKELNIKTPEEKAMDAVLGILEQQGGLIPASDPLTNSMQGFLPLLTNTLAQNMQQQQNNKYDDLLKYADLFERGLINKDQFEKIKQDVFGG